MLAVYMVVQLSYWFWLKHQPVLDICIVASGFLLRAVAGGAAAGIALSQWFLLVAGFGSLFMVAGKRYAEMMLAEKTGAKIRKSLESYSASYLRFVWGLSATVLITTYSLWAFEIRETENNPVWSAVSIVPFVVAVLRYSGAAGAGDRVGGGAHRCGLRVGALADPSSDALRSPLVPVRVGVGVGRHDRAHQPP